MTRNLPSGMNDVLHLTRSGDLSGATSMIQHLLSGAPAPEALRSSEQIIELKPEALDKMQQSIARLLRISRQKEAPLKHSYTGKGGTLAYHLYLPAIVESRNAIGSDAAWLYAIRRRFCAWHTDERSRRRVSGLRGSVSRTVGRRQRAAVLELVSSRR